MVRTAALVLGTAALVLLGLHVTAPAPVPPAAAVPGVGDAAPRFTLRDAAGVPVRVGGPSPRWTILTFFRRASSPW